MGLGSVFGKTLRDSRGAMLVVLGLLGVMVAAGGGTMASTYGTPEARAGLAALTAAIPPSLRGLYGDAVNVDTLGGFISWHYASYFALIAGLWSILALSSTLAEEARRGSLDLVVTTARSRRRIVVEKVGAHIAALALVSAALGAVAWATALAVALSARDEIGPGAAAGFAVGMVVRTLVAGSIAFALSPVLGRGASAGMAGAIMVGGYVVHGYRSVVPAFDTLDRLTWWSWTAGHSPLAGSVNWGGIAVTAAVAVVLLAVGAELFARRDIGVTGTSRVPTLPGRLLGVRGQVSRSTGEVLPMAVWWGVGLGLYGAVMAAASNSLLDLLADSPAIAAAFKTMIPGIDITTAAGFLQLAFADLGFVLVGLAAATFVGERWADESSGRLELLLTTPLSRARWAVDAGVASWLATGVLTAVLALAVAAGIASVGQDPVGPGAGTAVLALYGCALVGVGMAAGGLLGPSAAARTVAAVAVGTFLLDTLAPILRLPDWVAQLALTTHLGEPMAGHWDPAGMAVCATIAAAGLALGTWSLRRRDVAG